MSPHRVLLTAWLGAVAWLGAAPSAFAYPHFIGYGYTSCAACHYNPLGNGPLTDYGRATSATAIAARPFFVSSRTTEERLGETSGFLFAKKLPEWLRPSLDYRGLFLSSVQQGESLQRWIHMQADVNVVLRGPNDRLFASASIGLAPVPEQIPQQQRDEISSFISREHYVAGKPVKWLGLYLGLMDPAFGIRVPDHIAYLRSKSFLDKNDQTHGLMLHGGFKKADIALHLMAGNLFQAASLRQKGVSGTAEFDVGEGFRLGGSGWMTDGNYRSRQMGAVHARIGVGEGSAFLAQIGVIRDDPVTEEAKVGAYFFTQYLARLTRGLNLLGTIEYYTAEYLEDAARRSYRAGPGLQYFPMQRVELRTELLGSRQVGGSTLDPDIFTWMTQVHLWF